MLKVVIFDSGYGGEFFADLFEEVFPTVEVVRVIDWRHAKEYLTSPRKARRLAVAALRKHIGEVDLIILANHLLAATSLKHFRKIYKNQQFIGLELKQPDTFLKRNTVIITTKAVTRTLNYHHYVFKTKRRLMVITPDSWPAKIDEGVLTEREIAETIRSKCCPKHYPEEIILACSHFDDIKAMLRHSFGQNVKIYDSFSDTIREAARVLHIRGGVPKQK